MDASWVPWAWLGFSILLFISELFAPSLVALFFGMGGVLVALLHFLGLVESFGVSLMLWGVFSVALLLMIRKALLKWIPAERTRVSIDEDAALFGTEVEVIADIDSSHSGGRVRLAGTSWPATTTEGVIPKGSRARLVLRENIAWVVEPVDDADSIDEPDPIAQARKHQASAVTQKEH